MRKIFAFTLAALLATMAMAQNTATYDSTRNFLGRNPMPYTGQEFYLKGKPTDPPILRSAGYDDLIKDPAFVEKELSDIGKNIYKPAPGSIGSDYAAVAEHTYKVLEVTRDPEATTDHFTHGKIYFIKLQDKADNDIVYYKYDTTAKARFPFVVMGYWDKIKTSAKGRQFVFADEVFAGSTDYTTGKPLTITTGDKWKCVDVIVDKKYYNLCLLLENPSGEKAAIMVASVYGVHASGSVYTLEEATLNRSRWGTDFDMILKSKVKPGFTKVMASLAWGEPDHVNPTTTSAGRTEQWVYKDNKFLYFDEQGKLTTIQE